VSNFSYTRQPFLLSVLDIFAPVDVLYSMIAAVHSSPGVMRTGGASIFTACATPPLLYILRILFLSQNRLRHDWRRKWGSPPSQVPPQMLRVIRIPAFACSPRVAFKKKKVPLDPTRRFSSTELAYPLMTIKTILASCNLIPATLNHARDPGTLLSRGWHLPQEASSNLIITLRSWENDI
jgi:hypothetical protein